MLSSSRIVVVCLAGTAFGCTTPQSVRDDTRVIALYVQSVKKDLEDFSALLDDAVKARTATIAALELKTLRAQQAVARDLQSLDLIQDKERAQLLVALQNAPSLILAQRKDYESKSAAANDDVTKAKSAFNFHLSKLTDTASTLLKLAENRPLKDEARFYVDFVKQVRNHVDEDLKADAKAAAQDSASKAAQRSK
jgi:hypothetical protein